MQLRAFIRDQTYASGLLPAVSRDSEQHIWVSAWGACSSLSLNAAAVSVARCRRRLACSGAARAERRSRTAAATEEAPGSAPSWSSFMRSLMEGSPPVVVK